MRFLEPVVRESPSTYQPYSWSFEQTIGLPIPGPLENDRKRRSTRAFAPVSLLSLSKLLWYAARCEETISSQLGFELQLRPAPSAGAIHPIHILVELSPAHPWSRYDPVLHQLQVLSEPRALKELRSNAERYVDPGDGCLMAFVAEPGMTEAKYANCESLIWRDAGVLQGVVALTAARADLALCLLGLTGDHAIVSLSGGCQLQGVGVAILGARPG